MKKQLVISSATLKSALDSYTTYLVDWAGLPSILGTQEFETSSEFDALNRATKITLPEDVNTDRKEIIPTYNRAGALEKVAYDSTEYVKNIVYTAKGQRLLIAFGNDVMTRYAYDPRTFRLLRQRSEKYTYSLVSDTHTYTPDSGTNRQDDGFNFDLVGNIMKILIRVNDCGITGSTLGANALDREFEYDPLYRVTSADGRESDTQNQNDYLYSDAPAPGSPNADDVRAYARQYNYDKLGNVQQVTQSGTNGFTRNFVYNTGVNTLQQIETGSSVLIQDFTYDTVGNQITAGTTRNYVWNAVNQLITYYNQAGMADPTIFAQYDYDAGGNRVSKMVRTGTAGSPVYERTIYIDGIFEYHILENGTTYEKNYVHVLDDQSRIAMVRIGTPFPDDITDAVTYNLEDQIGSSTLRLNTTGGVIDKEEYYPFGDSSLRTFTKKRYRYVGREKDLESGLYYYGARYYAAWTCRFISVDPLATDYPFYTPYNYAGNKPINRIDIDGMQEGAQRTDTAAPQRGTGSNPGRSGSSGGTTQGAAETKPSFLTGIASKTSSTFGPMSPNNGEVPSSSTGSTVTLHQSSSKPAAASQGGAKDTTEKYTGPTLSESAILAENVYNIAKGTQKKGKKAEGTDYVLVDALNYIEFTMGIYQRTDEEGTVFTAVVFAGTDDALDIQTNVAQGLGAPDYQYHLAAMVGRSLKGMKNVTFIGHSLGGGLASLAALSGDNPAITFNAAGLSTTTKLLYGVANVKATKIDAYVIPGEIVNTSLQKFGQGADGNVHYILPVGTSNPIKLHQMNQIKKGLNMTK